MPPCESFLDTRRGRQRRRIDKWFCMVTSEYLIYLRELDAIHFPHKRLTGERRPITGTKLSCAPREFQHSPLADLLILRSQSGIPQFPDRSATNRRRIDVLSSRSPDGNARFIFPISSRRIMPSSPSCSSFSLLSPREVPMGQFPL